MRCWTWFWEKTFDWQNVLDFSKISKVAENGFHMKKEDCSFSCKCCILTDCGEDFTFPAECYGDGSLADAAWPRVDQNSLSRAEPAAHHQRVVSCGINHWYWGCLLQGPTHTKGASGVFLVIMVWGSDPVCWCERQLMTLDTMKNSHL